MEVCNRIIKRKLMAVLHDNPGKTWVDVLPEVQEMVNSSPARALDWQAPTKAMFGQANRLGGCEEDAGRCAAVARQWWLTAGREGRACRHVLDRCPPVYLHLFWQPAACLLALHR